TTANATSNYTFNGWYKESTFSNQVTSSTIYNTIGNSTIYAKWTETSIVLPTPTRTGYTFSGWYSDSSLTNKVGNAGSSYTPTSSLTLYAKWTDTTKPTISLSPNTGATYVSGGKAVTVNLSDSGSGLKASQSIYYAWSTSNATVPSSWSSVTSTNTAGAKSATVTVPATSNSSLTGTYYLWIKAGTLVDVSGNTSNQVVSALFKFDNTNPTVSVSTSKTTKSITAVATASATSGISKYEFSKDNGTTWINNGTNKTYTFTDLTHNTSYNIKVRVTSGVGKQIFSITENIKTTKIDAPTYMVSPNGDLYAQSKEVTTTAKCTTCTNEYSIDGGKTWVIFPSTVFKIKYMSSDVLVTRSNDGTNIVSSTYSITNIDQTSPGILKINAGSIIPGGYLPCDGRAVSRTTYANLFKVIGTTYGSGDGSTTFNVPNLNGKISVGKSSGDFASLGSTGGSISNTLTMDNIPSHTHSIPALSGTAANSGAHTHTMAAKGSVSSSFGGSTVSTSNPSRSLIGTIWNVATTGYLSADGIFTKAPKTSDNLHRATDITNMGTGDGYKIDATHTHSVTFQGKVSSTFKGNLGTTSSSGSHTHSISTTASTSGASGKSSSNSLNNLQPYTTVNYIIKY
ncbi:MAG: tail fiber protein, partial [Oscillospiraceae bacterium]